MKEDRSQQNWGVRTTSIELALRMLTWLLAAVGVVTVVWLLLPEKPVYYHGKHQSDIPSFVQSSFMVLREGAVIHIAHEASDRRLRLRTIRLPNSELGLRFELPNTPVNTAHAEAVRRSLKTSGFNCESLAPMERLWLATDPPICAVDRLSPVDAFRAFEAARDGLGLDQEARYTMNLEGIMSFAAIREYKAKHSRNAS